MSYYEELLRLKGIKIGIMQREARNADRIAARLRRKLIKEAQNNDGTPRRQTP